MAGRFNTTHWSVVLQAGQRPSPESAAALEHLCRTYWLPLYLFILRQGHQIEDAKDLTQEFFARLLERNDFDGLDPRKGKFRTFLLAALTHFLANERDRARAAKRGGGQRTLSLDELAAGQRFEIEAVSGLSADKLFDQRWALLVLERALDSLHQETLASGKLEQFELLKKYMTEEPRDGEYAAAAQRLGMTGTSVAVTVHRFRQRYRELVRAEVAQTVCTPLEVEEDLRYLFEALSA
jgi:RNA polymerase sigma-70 factor (ECF subfamily)